MTLRYYVQDSPYQFYDTKSQGSSHVPTDGRLAGQSMASSHGELDTAVDSGRLIHGYMREGGAKQKVSLSIRNGWEIKTVAICLYLRKETQKDKPATDKNDEVRVRGEWGGGTRAKARCLEMYFDFGTMKISYIIKNKIY